MMRTFKLWNLFMFICGRRPWGAAALLVLLFVHFWIKVYVKHSPVPASSFPYQWTSLQYVFIKVSLKVVTKKPRLTKTRSSPSQHVVAYGAQQNSHFPKHCTLYTVQKAAWQNISIIVSTQQHSHWLVNNKPKRGIECFWFCFLSLFSPPQTSSLSYPSLV